MVTESSIKSRVFPVTFVWESPQDIKVNDL